MVLGPIEPFSAPTFPERARRGEKGFEPKRRLPHDFEASDSSAIIDQVLRSAKQFKKDKAPEDDCDDDSSIALEESAQSDIISIEALQQKIVDLQKELSWHRDQVHRLHEILKELKDSDLSLGRVEVLAQELGSFQKAVTLEKILPVAVKKISEKQELIRTLEASIKNSSEQLVEAEIIFSIDSEDLAAKEKLCRIKEKKSCDLNHMFLRSKGLKTPLTYAIFSGKWKMVHFLIEDLHLNPNQPDRSHPSAMQGMTPLMVAISAGNKEMVRYLITKNAFIDLPCGDYIPLTYSIESGRREIAHLLIVLGANPQQADRKGRVPAELLYSR